MINVLTYDHPHRKTADLLMMLAAQGAKDVRVIALPWTERKTHKPLVWHRPSVTWHPHPHKMAKALFFGRITTDMANLPLFVAEAEDTLVGGAGILPPEVVQGHRVINSHPGYLPYVRGLDALKWAIHDRLPIGVTTHLCGPEPDAGKLLDQYLLKVRPFDTFHSVAMGQYELEVEMLVEAIDKQPGEELGTDAPVRRRMNHRQEIVMMRRFEEMLS